MAVNQSAPLSKKTFVTQLRDMNSERIGSTLCGVIRVNSYFLCEKARSALGVIRHLKPL